MKRLVLSLIITAALFVQTGCFANAKKDVGSVKLTSIIDKYKGVEGVDILNIGSIGTSMLKRTIKSAAGNDKDARAVLKAISGVNKMVIIDFEDCSSAVDSNIRSDIADMLSGSEMLLEVKNDGDTLHIYGVMDEASDVIRDLVLYSEQDGALICLL